MHCKFCGKKANKGKVDAHGVVIYLCDKHYDEYDRPQPKLKNKFMGVFNGR